jgi:hypothetical protein
MTSKHNKEIYGNNLEIEKGQKGQKFICEFCNKNYNNQNDKLSKDEIGFWTFLKCPFSEIANTFPKKVHL